jgi:flagellar FliJ protein
MKAFAFNLEKVLDLREFREDEARIELGRAVGVLAETENRIRAAAEERARAAAAQFGPGNDAATMRQYMLYLLRLDGLRERLLEEAAAAELKVEEAREAYLEASRERKVLEKLREKRQKERRRETLSEETKTLDDIPRRTIT